MRKNQSTEIWQGHITACDKSDLNKKNYCAKHNIVLSTFGYWKKRLGSKFQTIKFFTHWPFPLKNPLFQFKKLEVFASSYVIGGLVLKLTKVFQQPLCCK